MTTENFSTSPISVQGGQPFTFSVYFKSGSSLRATIEWRNAKHNSIGTSTTPTTTAPGSSPYVNGTAPASAVQAVITVTIEHTQYQTSSFNSVHFQQTLPGAPAASSLALTSPTWSGIAGYTTSTNLTGRFTDDHQYNWTTPDGNYQVGGFGGGTAWPLTTGVRSLALVTGTANTNVGVTFRSGAPAGMTQGLVFRYSKAGSVENYWRACRTQLQYVTGTTWTTVTTFTTPFADNDRIVVQLNGATLSVFRNGNNQIYTTGAATFNQTAFQHGLVVE
jgi:hypothetical protein